MPKFPVVDGVEMCCKRLHPMTPDNTRRGGNGQRLCLECDRLRGRARVVREGEGGRRKKRERWHAIEEDKKRRLLMERRGTTLEWYDATLAAQGGVCAICGGDDPVGKAGRSFAVDHDHDSGALRGLLCGRCNVMLGNAKDEPATLRAGAAYREAHRS